MSLARNLTTSMHGSFAATIGVFLTCYKMLPVQDFPGGSVIKNLPTNAGDTSSIPAREDSACRGAAKPVSHNHAACAAERRGRDSRVQASCSPRSATGEATAARSQAPQAESLSLSPTGEKSAQQQRPTTAPNKYIVEE